ncbi:MAG: four helix bundle protein [Candidatus Marinimicrobia bacterium]|nr:four helix bundle protein [Candidatus Neomarinimicrobiota bacterium]
MSEGSFKDLKVYKQAFRLATEIYEITKSFPEEERYALTDQIRRSSRSVCANLAEGYRKRLYVKHFVAKMTDADGEASETTVWLDFALDAKYITSRQHAEIAAGYREVGRMPGSMLANPDRFLPKDRQVSEIEPAYAAIED